MKEALELAAATRQFFEKHGMQKTIRFLSLLTDSVENQGDAADGWENVIGTLPVLAHKYGRDFDALYDNREVCIKEFNKYQECIYFTQYELRDIDSPMYWPSKNTKIKPRLGL
jgi:hypothetical protein